MIVSFEGGMMVKPRIFAAMLAIAVAQGALIWRTNELRLQVEAELHGAHSETQRLGRAAAIFDRAMQSWWDGREYEIDRSTQSWMDDPEFEDI
jgi:hypothetical protein